jgi:hypothetical protein
MMTVEQFIRDMAKKLPQQSYTVTDRVTLQGTDARLADVKEIDGQPVDPEKEYTMTLPRVHIVNHKRRMRRAYKKGGKGPLIDYVIKFVPLENRFKMIQFINALNE